MAATNSDVRIEVSDRCMKSFPCKHTVQVFKNNKLEKDYGAMFAPKIAKLYQSYGLTPPEHFQGYENHPMFK